MIDFKEIIKQTNKYNFHSHTQFCDARDKMEDIVTEGIKEGFCHIGFTPHSPLPIESPCNMDVNDVELYLNEINRLREEYGDKINIYSSMEIDYLNNEWNASNSYFSNLSLDYRLSSIHFIPSLKDENVFIDVDGSHENFKEKMQKFFDGDIKYVVDKFFDQTLQMIETGGFDVIGHFDKIGNNANSYQKDIEDEEWYRKKVREVFDAIMDYHYIVEINTKAFKEHNRFFPNERYFEWFNKYDCTILINSDVHFKDRINYGREEALSVLNKVITKTRKI